MNFIEELRQRGMLQDVMPGAEEQFAKEMTSCYVGIDPTADSLHIGHLVSVMMLKHLQIAGHRPILVVGGATGMIGDPSGKSSERNLLDEPTLRHNQNSIKEQLSQLIDFDSQAPNAALMTNNYDWMSPWSFLEFIRDIGKHITVNYMMAKDSVKKRLSGEGDGMSFTEFTYQLVQGYDFLYLYENYNCRVQMGGSDQWGNITTGTELIRRTKGGQAFGITCPLIKKADGTKFGKTESGNIWLAERYTSVYKFYQFWIGVSDEDAERYIKIFTLLDIKEIERLIIEHREQPHLRLLQKRLAKEVTTMIHSSEKYEKAVEASSILFGGKASEILPTIDSATLNEVFEGVPQFEVSRTIVEQGVSVMDLFSVHSGVFASKGELRRLVEGGGLSVNGHKVSSADDMLSTENVIASTYILVQKGKKNYSLLKLS